MQAKVPKFLDIEDRVIGPLTLRQFIVLAAGAAFIGIFNFFIEFFPLLLLVAGAIGGTATAIAFVRINQRSFIDFAFSVFGFYFGPRQFVWRRIPKKVRIQRKKGKKEEKKQPAIPAGVARRKIRELASELDMYHQVKRRDY